MNFNFESIRHKLILQTVLICFVSLLVACSFFIVYDHLQYRNILKNDISILSRILADRSAASLLFDDNELANKNLNSLETRQEILAACVYQVNDVLDELSLFASYKRSSSMGDACIAPDTLLETIKAGEFILRDSHLYYLYPINFDNQQLGYIYSVVSLKQAYKRLQNYILVALVVILGGTGIALLIVLQVEKRITAPLLALGKTAEEIANKENYSIRALVQSNDEVSTVVRSFNQMLDKIEYEDHKLRESEEKFRLFSDKSNVGMFQANEKGQCVYVNKRYCEITGLSPDAIYEDGWLQSIHPEHYYHILSDWRRCQKTGESFTFECRLDTSEEREIWISGYIGPLTQDDSQSQGFLGTISDVSDLKSAQFQLEQMAFYDVLTGLANRRLFRNRLENSLTTLSRTNNNIALLLIDLDNFKFVNDTLGHDTGDELLKIISQRLVSCVRSTDTVSRMGGDEFIILLADISTTQDASKVASKIISTLREPIYFSNQEFSITASLGISIAPHDTSDAQTLIKNADLALYRAKEEGRDKYQFFTQEMNTLLLEHIQTVKLLGVALERSEFFLHFQPQFRISDQQITGFEALVRWDSKELGFVRPDKFIAIAEDSGQIKPIGRWIISEACRNLRVFIDEGIANASTSLAINISVVQFSDPQLVAFIQDCLYQYEISPHQIELEVTETLLMENMDAVIDTLQELKTMGISLAIDDFGTGYSSLSYLKQLPMNIVKIDRSFIQGIPSDKDAMEISAAVIAMAHKLNYEVVAEGIETEEHIGFLQDIECDYGQGFLFSKPLSPSDLIAFCRSRKKGILRSV